MKTFTELMECCTTADINPGNKLGVTNHYTPIENILTNVRNLFQPLTGIVAAIGEDGISLKIHSSKFINPKEVNIILHDHVYHNDVCLDSYIKSQGLDGFKMVNLGQYIICYYYPTDIVKKGKKGEVCPCAMLGDQEQPEPSYCPCKEMKEHNMMEAEMEGFIMEDDEEIENEFWKGIVDALKMDDKFKAAKKFSELVAKEIELPDNYYWAAVKLEDGEEAIALRHKTEIKRPHGKKVSKTESLLYIFGLSQEGMWIDNWDQKDKLIEDDIKTLIENIIKMLQAKPTNDKQVWELSEKPEDGDKEDKDDDDDDDDDDNDYNDDDDNDDNEDDNK